MQNLFCKQFHHSSSDLTLSKSKIAVDEIRENGTLQTYDNWGSNYSNEDYDKSNTSLKQRKINCYSVNGIKSP